MTDFLFCLFLFLKRSRENIIPRDIFRNEDMHPAIKLLGRYLNSVESVGNNCGK